MVSTLTNWIKRQPLAGYFVLIFAAEWLIFITLSRTMQPLLAILIGSWLPNGVGLLVTYLVGGRSGLRELGGKIVLWQIGAHWYAIALLAPVAIAGLAIGLYHLLGGLPIKLAATDQILPIFAISVFTGAMGEELGWRGTALPRLQGRFNPLMASLSLGFLWGLYHLPAFFIPGAPQQAAALLPFLIGAIDLTILVTWTFNRTHGSLLPVFLYHFAFNFVLSVTGLPAIPLLFWLFVTVAGLMAIAVVILDWGRFSQSPSTHHPGTWKIP
jgi:membrane protease YdiL (CAAX protease family)